MRPNKQYWSEISVLTVTIMKVAFGLLSLISFLSVLTGLVFLCVDICGGHGFELAVWLVVQGSLSGLFCLIQLATYTSRPSKLRDLEEQTEGLRMKINSKLEILQLAPIPCDSDEELPVTHNTRKNT